MKILLALATVASLSPLVARAEDPFVDVVESRHGLMLMYASNLGTLGRMAKGETPYDAATATRAADRLVALASVMDMDLFPEGSEFGKAADSYAKPEIWANQPDFLAKIADLNTAAIAMKASAGTDQAAVQAGMAALGGACGACHKAYRAPES
jgi:cytochrome c556